MEETPQLAPPHTDALPKQQGARYSYLILCVVVLLMSGGYIVYSQTWAFAWDEGFHMLTAKLIKDGRLPYIDFFFPQAPLNAYWNAAWMRLFGDSWRMVHALAATLTMAAIFLAMDFVYRHWPVPRWRLAASLLAAVLIGANIQVFQFGPVGQGYALALLLSVIAFRLTVYSVGVTNPLAALAAGLTASAAAGSTLLAAPYVPVLLLWAILYNRVGHRWIKVAAYVLGGVIPWLPVLWLFTRSPQVVRFNIFDYHMRYREVDWADAIPHDIDVLTGWLESSQALLLGLLGLAGLVYVIKVVRGGAAAHPITAGRATDPATGEPLPSTAWDRTHRSEFYLCAWLVLTEAIHISRAHPTFPRYFLLLVVPLSILAVAGLYVVGSRLGRPDRPWWAVGPTIALMLLGTAKATFDERDNMHWKDLVKIADKVRDVTPPGGVVLADEQIYFLAGRLPPEGLEHRDSHKLKIDPGLAKKLHVISKAELKKRVTDGFFATVQSCEDDDMTAWGVDELFAHNAEFEDCKVFWGLKKAPKSPAN
jgi:hypothetical protein